MFDLPNDALKKLKTTVVPDSLKVHDVLNSSRESRGNTISRKQNDPSKLIGGDDDDKKSGFSSSGLLVRNTTPAASSAVN